MGSGVFLIKQDGGLVEMSGRLFDSEDRLQALVAKYPGLLGGDQMDPVTPRRFVLAQREAGLASEAGGGSRWAVDHLFLDQDGVPTLVEVTRSSNTQLRREVVGQLLEYATHAVENWPVDLLQRSFEATCQGDGRDPGDVLTSILAAGVDPVAFWQKVKRNLEDGTIRLVFLADEIPPELRRIVEFLNEQMESAEVLAIEVKQYLGQDMTTLVARLIGQTEGARSRKAGAARETREWDETRFFAALQEKRGVAEAAAARRLLQWGRKAAGHVDWGSGKQDGSFIPVLIEGGVEYYPVVVYTYGRVDIQFQYLVSKPPFETEAKRRELLAKLNQIPGINLPPDSFDRRPSVKLEALVDEQRLTKFIGVLDWFREQIKAHHKPG